MSPTASAKMSRAALGTFDKTLLFSRASKNPIFFFSASARAVEKILRAVLSPTFGRNLTTLVNDTLSDGFAANLSCATTSFTCACSKNLRPLVIANGMVLCCSCSCISIAWKCDLYNTAMSEYLHLWAETSSDMASHTLLACDTPSIVRITKGFSKPPRAGMSVFRYTSSEPISANIELANASICGVLL